MEKKAQTHLASPENDLPLGEFSQNYMNLLLGGDRKKAFELIKGAVEKGKPVQDIYLEVFQSTQRRIGELWQKNLISVAQEHYCTAATQSIMAQLYPYIDTKNKTKNNKILIACVGGELHELGALMVTDAFEMDGWNTYYVGANAPSETLLAAIREQQPDILGISVTISFNIPKAIELIDLIRSNDRSHRIKIIVGGRAFNMAPDLWHKLKVDGFGEDFKSAVTTANLLCLN